MQYNSIINLENHVIIAWNLTSIDINPHLYKFYSEERPIIFEQWETRHATIIFSKYRFKNFHTHTRVCLCVSRKPYIVPMAANHQNIFQRIPKNTLNPQIQENSQWRLFSAIIWRGQIKCLERRPFSVISQSRAP